MYKCYKKIFIDIMKEEAGRKLYKDIHATSHNMIL